MSQFNVIARGALRHPLLWGAAATAGFYLALDAGLVEEPLVARYFAGHWAAYATTTMFLVGVAALVIKAFDLGNNFRSLAVTLFEGVATTDLRIADIPLMVQSLDKQPAWAQQTYLIGRLRAALDYLARKGSPDTLEDELRALADLDAERKAASFGIVRTMLWTMPFMGALGTVLGLASALSKPAPEATVGGLPANLPPGFALILDTTTLALLLTASLLVVMLVAEHFENRLLTAVDGRVNRELVGRFRGAGSGKIAQPVSASGSQTTPGLSDTMVEAMEKIAERQTEIWQSSLEAATRHWEEQTELLKRQIGAGGGPGGTAGPNVSFGGAGHGGGIGGGSGGGGGGAGGDVLHLTEAITASLAGLGSMNLMIHNEIMAELAEIVRQDCRNWPYRKRLRRGARSAAAPAGDEVDWIDPG